MIWAILSTRIRTWLLFAVLLPIGGRVLQAVAPRVSQRNQRAGDLLTKAGGYARDPRGKRPGTSSRGGTPPAPPLTR